MTISAKTKPKPVIYASHTQYAIVNEADSPMNQWGIFTNPATSIMLFHREDMAKKELVHLQKKYGKCELTYARVVEVCVTWPKSDE